MAILGGLILDGILKLFRILVRADRPGSVLRARRMISLALSLVSQAVCSLHIDI